jgi:hypothetical protein
VNPPILGGQSGENTLQNEVLRLAPCANAAHLFSSAIAKAPSSFVYTELTQKHSISLQIKKLLLFTGKALRARDWNRTSTPCGRQILSLLRLPIPPPGQFVLVTG